MIISIRNVTKRYEKHVAVDNMNLEVPRGIIFGMLGPNGAGKTSLIRMITTITAPDEGEIFFDGAPVSARTPEQIGYLPEERGLYKKMKVGEHLMYLGQLKGLRRAAVRQQIDYWLQKFDIADWWNKKIEELSKGMQQKVQFIATVLHQPRLIILDEPFSGLDPINSNLIKEEIHLLNQQGTSIIFSTHRMEQVEEMCDHIVLINQGKNVLDGEVRAIKQLFKEHLFFIETVEALPPDFSHYFTVKLQTTKSATVQLAQHQHSNDIIRFVLERGNTLLAFHEILPTFNEIFIRRVRETSAA